MKFAFCFFFLEAHGRQGFFIISFYSFRLACHFGGADILSAVNTQIQGLQSNLLKAEMVLASQIASEVQPETYVFKKKGNEQQFNFYRKVIKRSTAAVKALESGNIGKAKEELNEGISLLNNRQK